MSDKIDCFFDFTMKTTCPHCDNDVDLDSSFYNDENYWTEKFRKWINNESEMVEEEIECVHCEKTFKIGKIHR